MKDVETLARLIDQNRPASSFETLMAGRRTVAGTLAKQSTRIRITEYQATKSQRPPFDRKGNALGLKRDPMYKVSILVADEDGDYAPTFEKPKVGKEYFIRAVIDQLQAEPLLQGFKLTWKKPSGWVWEDGLGSTTYDETVSNPMNVTRVARPTVKPGTKNVFKATVTKVYRTGPVKLSGTGSVSAQTAP